MIKLDKGIPIPQGRGRKHEIADTLDAMELGDSFTMPLSERPNLQQCISQYKRRSQNAVGKDWTVRKEVIIIRCWRIK